MTSKALLHEAAHALAHVRRIKNTSRQGQWHNARFKALAEELGIEVSKDDQIGWSPTTIPAATRDADAPVIDKLGQALRMHRAAEIVGGTTEKPTPPPCFCSLRGLLDSPLFQVRTCTYLTASILTAFRDWP